MFTVAAIAVAATQWNYSIPLWLRLNHLFLKTTHYGNYKVEIFPKALSFKSLILYVGTRLLTDSQETKVFRNRQHWLDPY